MCAPAIIKIIIISFGVQCNLFRNSIFYTDAMCSECARGVCTRCDHDKNAWQRGTRGDDGILYWQHQSNAWKWWTSAAFKQSVLTFFHVFFFSKHLAEHFINWIRSIQIYMIHKWQKIFNGFSITKRHAIYSAVNSIQCIYEFIGIAIGIEAGCYKQQI